MRIICFTLLLITFNVSAGEDMALKRQAALDFINAIGDFDEMHEKFNYLIKSQFDLYLRNNPDVTDADVEPYKQSVNISKDKFLDYQVDQLFEDFTILEINELTLFFNSRLGNKWLLKKNNIGLNNMGMANDIYIQIKEKMDYDLQNKKSN
jgi:hypothetical protein